MMEEASIFLQGYQKAGELWVTSDTLAALFTLQYCQNPCVSIIIVEPTPNNSHTGNLKEPGQNSSHTINNSSHKPANSISLEKHTEHGSSEHKNTCSSLEHNRNAIGDITVDPSDCIFPVDPSVFTFKYSVNGEEDCPAEISNCVLPAALLNSEPVWCVAGLCSTLRFMLHRTVNSDPNHHAARLLGFRRSCLQACAEVSVWTKFCEVEALRSLREVAVHGFQFVDQWDSVEGVQENGKEGGEKKKEEGEEGTGKGVEKDREEKEKNGKRVEKDREEGEEERNEGEKNGEGAKNDKRGGEEEEKGEKKNEKGVEKDRQEGEKVKKEEEDIKEVEEANKTQEINITIDHKKEKKLLIVPELVRYERHLQRPPLLHNALKTKQKYIRDTVKDKAERDRLLQLPLCELPDIEHTYAEGLNMTLADILLFVSFHILLTKLESLVNLSSIPLVLKWHRVILGEQFVKGAMSVLSNTLAHLGSDGGSSGLIYKSLVPDVPDESIYKSDPERYKPRWRSFTHQEDIDQVLGILNDDVEMDYSDHPAQTISLPWASLPPNVNPREGQLPPSRLERKCQQLENVVTAVESVAKDGDIIVDFCAGGGHVGIILAYRLPKCKIVLVENKEASLVRAKERIDALSLKNVIFVQCNLDYFKGDFNVGVCLHACGVATDLVLLKCMEKKASFVCSPCCYGGVQANHILSYPRSQAYQNIPLNQDQYITLGHTADQTHGKDNPKTSQGQRCMRLVDSDRLMAFKELGYSTSLTLMHPPHCSPKNHLLIGLLKT